MANSQALAELRPVQEWVNLLRDPASRAFASLSAIYGADRPLLREKAAFVLEMLDLFPRLFPGDAPVLLVRSAGRINLIGMHVDHRGGVVNPIAVRETWCLCRPRAGRPPRLRDSSTSACSRAGNSAFSRNWERRRSRTGTAGRRRGPRNARPPAPRANGSITSSPRRSTSNTSGRLFAGAPTTPLRGMDMLIAGTLPRGAGVSSVLLGRRRRRRRR